MTTNPYAPPTAPLAPIPQWSDICADGDCLVVRDGVALPPRCPFTNEPISPLSLREHIFDATPSFRLVFRRHRYRVLYGLAPSLRSKQFKGILRNALTTTVAALVPLVFSFFFQFFHIAFLIPMFLNLISITGRPALGTLRVVRSENERLWLAGCCPEFLAFIRNEYRTLYSQAMSSSQAD